MSIFKAAAIQMRSGTDIGRNAATFETMVREAAANGATYVQTPEMTGALVRDREARRAAVRPGGARPHRHRARRGSRPSSASICMSARPRSCAPTASSPTAPCCSGPDGERIATYDKIHMFDVDLDNGESWRESAAYEPGTEAVVADLPFARLGFADLLRFALPAAVPRRSAGRRRGADGAGGLHAPDRRGALACAAARPGHRERRLGDRRRAGRPA